MYWIKRKIRQFKKVWRYLPVIWKSYDFDYSYAVELFKMKLEDIAAFLESDKAVTESAPEKAKQIREVLRLLNKVDEDLYFSEKSEALIQEFGQNLDLDFIKSTASSNFVELDYDYPEDWSSSMRASYRTRASQLAVVAFERQEEDNRKAWELVGKHITGWWD